MDFVTPSFLSYFLKAMHIIGFTAWFAALFYLVRLFVYHGEALGKNDENTAVLANQYRIMEERLYKFICSPAMMWTFTFGILMLINNSDFLSQPWMHVKFLFLIGLLVYHFWAKKTMKRLANGSGNFPVLRYRLMNEVATVLLVGIVVIAVFRNNINYIYYIVGMVVLSLLLWQGVRAYKSAADPKEE